MHETYLVHQGNAYELDQESLDLMWAPMKVDGLPDWEAGGYVAWDLIDEDTSSHATQARNALFKTI